MKVLVLGHGSYRSLFKDEGYTLVETPEEADLICFTGGTDVDPAIYGDTPHYTTDNPDEARDLEEVEIFHTYKDKPKVGICRGAQLMCALSGGKLYQHVDGHGSGHMATTGDGETMRVTSSHHQMMYPVGVDHKLLLACENLSSRYFFEVLSRKDPPLDYEVVYFPATKSLCHQPHPEWMDINSRYRRWFFETVEDMMHGRL